jgi:hypothetical protein
VINKKAFALLGVVPAIQSKNAAEKLIATMACGLGLSVTRWRKFCESLPATGTALIVVIIINSNTISVLGSEYLVNNNVLFRKISAAETPIDCLELIYLVSWKDQSVLQDHISKSCNTFRPAHS